MKLKKAVIKLKKQHIGPTLGRQRYGMLLALDNGFKRDELPPVKKVQNSLNH